jgi:hypothetical protein
LHSLTRVRCDAIGRFARADKICRMNERERFFQSVFTRTVDRIATMSETEVVDELRAAKATRDSYEKTLSFLTSSSLVSAENAEDEIDKLRVELNSTAHSGDSALRLSDYIEDALKKRLQTLRKQG